ncbi:hypothetical protein HDU67_000515, partial [Dinochytrium kinnereticum]
TNDLPCGPIAAGRHSSSPHQRAVGRVHHAMSIEAGPCQQFSSSHPSVHGPTDPFTADTSRDACSRDCGSSTLNNGGPYSYAGFASESGDQTPYCVCLKAQTTSPGQCYPSCTNVGPCGASGGVLSGLHVYVFPAIVAVVPAPPTQVTTQPPAPPPPVVTTAPPVQQTSTTNPPANPSATVADVPQQPGATTQPPLAPPASVVTSLLTVTGSDGVVTTSQVVNTLTSATDAISSSGDAGALSLGQSELTITSIGANGIATVFVVTQAAGGFGADSPSFGGDRGSGGGGSTSSFPVIGGAIGGVLAAALVVFALVLAVRRRRQRTKKSNEARWYRTAGGAGSSLAAQPHHPDEPESNEDRRESWTSQPSESAGTAAYGVTTITVEQAQPTPPGQDSKLATAGESELFAHFEISYPEEDKKEDTKKESEKWKPDAIPFPDGLKKEIDDDARGEGAMSHPLVLPVTSSEREAVRDSEGGALVTPLSTTRSRVDGELPPYAA